jgi:RNA polymerase sigma factor (sigma-70 family)
VNAVAPSLSSDYELVAAARAGYDPAYEELYRRYYGRIAAYVYRLVGDFARAEDVTQDTFLSALRRLRATESEIAFKPWIYEIARNASIDLYRRNSRAEEVSINADVGMRPADRQRLVGSTAPDAAAVDRERLSNLQSALDELAESHNQIIVLRELEGLSYREIAERMGTTRASVESTLFRARRRLEHEYSELDSGRRCAAMSATITRLSEGIASPRDRRRLARHLRRCAGCRRSARELGVDTAVERAPVRSKVAALLPLPALFRRGLHAREAAAPVQAARLGFQHTLTSWASSGGLGMEAVSTAWAKGAAAVAAVAIVGGAAVDDPGSTPRPVTRAAVDTPAVESAAAERVSGAASRADVAPPWARLPGPGAFATTPVAGILAGLERVDLASAAGTHPLRAHVPQIELPALPVAPELPGASSSTPSLSTGSAPPAAKGAAGAASRPLGAGALGAGRPADPAGQPAGQGTGGPAEHSEAAPTSLVEKASAAVRELAASSQLAVVKK